MERYLRNLAALWQRVKEKYGGAGFCFIFGLFFRGEASRFAKGHAEYCKKFMGCMIVIGQLVTTERATANAHQLAQEMLTAARVVLSNVQGRRILSVAFLAEPFEGHPAYARQLSLWQSLRIFQPLARNGWQTTLGAGLARLLPPYHGLCLLQLEGGHWLVLEKYGSGIAAELKTVGISNQRMSTRLEAQVLLEALFATRPKGRYVCCGVFQCGAASMIDATLTNYLEGHAMPVHPAVRVMLQDDFGAEEALAQSINDYCLDNCWNFAVGLCRLLSPEASDFDPAEGLFDENGQLKK